MNKKVLRWIIPTILLCISIILVLWNKAILLNKYNNDLLSNIVYGLTKEYQLRQSVTALIIFLVGYLVTACLLPYTCALYMGLSFPTGLAIWNFASIIILISNMKYCLSSMIMLTGGIISTIFIWRREYLKKINYWEIVRHVMYMACFILIVSFGFMPIITTYDSHVFIYQFGEMIANQGTICTDAVGACIKATGISSALMVSLARFANFETIDTFHWMLILSLLLSMFHFVKKVIEHRLNRKWAVVVTSILCGLFFGIPSFLYLANMINSCTYIMVYLTIICLLSFEISQYNIDGGWIIISLFLVWLAFGRLEGSVIVAFLIVCIGNLPISQKNMFVITIPTVILQCGYFLKIHFEERFATLSSRENFLSTSALIVIFFSMIIVVFYSLFFENYMIKLIRKYLPEIIIVGLQFICVIVGVYYSEKFVINLLAVSYNLELEYWKYLPHIAGIIFGGMIMKKRKVDWWDSVVFGYILLNFAICLGRELPLREGFGDSYNRILCSLVPLVFYMMIKRIVETEGA